MEQHNLLSKCHCSSPGFCPVFMRRMGTDPPDWKWCQNTCPEDRKSYYDILSRSPDTENKKLLEFFSNLDKLNIEKRLHLLYYLTMSDKYSRCEKSQRTQTNRNEKILSYINNQKNNPIDIKNLEILALGHSQKQFDTILDKPFIKKINLNDIDAGPFSGNKWAESRAFISNKELFSPTAEFIGFTTASWNIKYKSYTRIDNIDNWETIKILLNSKPKDGIVLCADIFCPCVWFPQEGREGCILDLFFGKDSGIIADKFKEIFKIEITEHVKVPYSNQMICHRSVFDEYRQYLTDFEVFEKIIWLINDFGSYYLLRHDDKVQQKHLADRIYAYLTEAVSCFWFYQQRKRMIFLPNAERIDSWYEMNNVSERVKWVTTS